MDNKQTIQKAIEILRQGGVVIYPTDTAFGVGCRIDCAPAVDKIFQIRNRPKTQALPVLVSSKAQALTYFVSPSDIVRHLMDTHWPGALTIIDICKKELLYSPIRADGETVGMRFPNHEIAQTLIEGVGIPIVGPSANIHGLKTPYTFEELDPELVSRVDFVVPGVCTVGNVSTVVDCTTDPYTIIRQGAVKL